jgi:2-phosphosulfolactate phosphatase
MGKIHVLMRKEDIDTEKIQGKVAVVFDVLLATSTITAGLHHGAKEVIPVLDGAAAHEEAKNRELDSYVLVGEYQGVTLEGFLDPNPLALKERVKEKTVILSTTNGTVAIRKASPARRVYAASLLNGNAIAETLRENHAEDTIVLICAGSGGEFCIEDFYGAGYVLDCLFSGGRAEWEMTDAARQFYCGAQDQAEQILLSSRVGRMMQQYQLEEDVCFVASRGFLETIPILDGIKMRMKEGDKHHV